METHAQVLQAGAAALDSLPRRDPSRASDDPTSPQGSGEGLLQPPNPKRQHALATNSGE